MLGFFNLLGTPKAFIIINLPGFPYNLRESPAKYIVQKVLQDAQDEAYYIVEPNIKEHQVFKITDYQEAAQKADIVAFLVAHNEFKKMGFTEGQVILDYCGVRNK